jgi:hypothetical protein
MEMNELDKTLLSKWVVKEGKGYERTTKVQYNDEAFANALRKWTEYPSKLDKRLKMMVRQGVSPRFRADLWRAGSGGAGKLQNHPQYYQETISDMGKIYIYIYTYITGLPCSHGGARERKERDLSNPGTRQCTHFSLLHVNFQ